MSLKRVWIILLLLSVMVSAQGSISGYVFDDETGEALPFVSMILETTKLDDITSRDGSYKINNIPYGKYILTTSFIGYVENRIIVEISPNNKLQVANFRLTCDFYYYWENANEELDYRGCKGFIMPASEKLYVTPMNVRSKFSPEVNQIIRFEEALSSQYIKAKKEYYTAKYKDKVNDPTTKQDEILLTPDALFTKNYCNEIKTRILKTGGYYDRAYHGVNINGVRYLMVCMYRKKDSYKPDEILLYNLRKNRLSLLEIFNR